MTLHPHSSAWYDRLAILQEDGYYYPWVSYLSPHNGENAYLTLLSQHLNRETDVLDVGCGHSKVAISVASKCRSILAYDRVESCFQLAQISSQIQGFANLNFICADSSADANLVCYGRQL